MTMALPRLDFTPLSILKSAMAAIKTAIINAQLLFISLFLIGIPLVATSRVLFGWPYLF
jgi:hypothetical protein